LYCCFVIGLPGTDDEIQFVGGVYHV
jgi:hypothetical protein